LHNCPAVTALWQEERHQVSILFTQKNLAGAGKPSPWMICLGRASSLPPPRPGRDHQRGRALGFTKGEAAASCSAVTNVLYLAGPPSFPFIHYLMEKCMKVLGAGTRPMVWAKLQTSEETSCGKQEKKSNRHSEGIQVLDGCGLLHHNI